jgi:hypothetical protein
MKRKTPKIKTIIYLSFLVRLDVINAHQQLFTVDERRINKKRITPFDQKMVSDIYAVKPSPLIINLNGCIYIDPGETCFEFYMTPSLLLKKACDAYDNQVFTRKIADSLISVGSTDNESSMKLSNTLVEENVSCIRSIEGPVSWKHYILRLDVSNVPFSLKHKQEYPDKWDDINHSITFLVLCIRGKVVVSKMREDSPMSMTLLPGQYMRVTPTFIGQSIPINLLCGGEQADLCIVVFIPRADQ